VKIFFPFLIWVIKLLGNMRDDCSPLQGLSEARRGKKVIMKSHQSAAGALRQGRRSFSYLMKSTNKKAGDPSLSAYE
jgi:hypothetical protein